MYTITLFGPPKITWRDQPIQFSRRQLQLLLYRLAASMLPLRRQYLAALFWPQRPDSETSRRLTHLLSALRQELPCPDLLVATRDHISLAPHLVDVDLWTIDQLSQRATNASQVCAMAMAVLRYHGPLLSGVTLSNYPELEQWLVQEQPYWEKCYLQLLHNLIDHFVAQSEFTTAIDYAKRYLNTEPAHEETHRLLIQLYTTTGQRTAALRQYEACLQVLAVQGLQPTLTTDQAFEDACMGLVVK